MCGRITQKSPPNQLGLKIVDLIEPGHDVERRTPRFNGAPGQQHWVIRRHPETGEQRLDRLWWGLIPHWVQDETGGRKPINAKAETIWRLPSFRAAYTKRRCIVPVDNFFEWRRIKGPGSRQAYAVAMKDGSPFGLAAIWENWRRPGTEEWVRTFAIITTTANELVSAIHDRMPVILHPKDYERWLSHLEPDPRDLLVPYPAEPMTMWPISTRVNSPANDDADLLTRASAS
jgi:putative SOS response-associated peptidase YedK